MRVPETTAGVKAGVATGRSIDLIHHSNQPQSFGDFAHGHYTAVVHQVNLLLLLLLEQGDFLLASTPTGDKEPYDMRETLRSFTRKPESTNCVFCLPHSHTYMSTRKERRSLQSPTDDNGTPATWTFGLVFQQAIDRQDRTTD